MFFLGDMVGYGPDPAPCVGWTRAYATHVVRGDHVMDGYFKDPEGTAAVMRGAWFHTGHQPVGLANVGALSMKVPIP